MSLSADREHRLYEALGTVAEATPMAARRALIAVWRRLAWCLPDTQWHRKTRGRLRRMMPNLVVGDWNWVLAILPEDGADTVFWRWATDAGYARATST